MKNEVKETWSHLQRTFPPSKNRQVRSPKTSGTKYPVRQRHFPEERVSHPYDYENLETGVDCRYVIPVAGYCEDGDNQTSNYAVGGKKM